VTNCSFFAFNSEQTVKQTQIEGKTMPTTNDSVEDKESETSLVDFAAKQRKSNPGGILK